MMIRTTIIPKRLIHSALVDTFARPHTYLRISLTERCNLRCNYCMPLEGVKLTPKSHLLQNEEIYRLSNIFVNLGIKKIRLTGGEPTIRADLAEIIKNLKAIPNLEQVSITTNGLLLTRTLPRYLQSGLDAVNISLDTLKAEKFEAISRRPAAGLKKVLAGIDLALQLNVETVKINCVLMRNINDDEILNFVDLTKNRKIDVRFIEYMPFDGNQWHDKKLVPSSEILKTIRAVHPTLRAQTPKPNETSKCYNIPGYQGNIGFISSMTEHFCSTCNRVRLTADGSLKVCLFGNNEISLRDALRNGAAEEEIIDMINSAVKRKKKQHAGLTLRRSSLSKLNRIVISLENHYIRARNFSSLSHEKGMVDVGDKLETDRKAIAYAEVQVGLDISQLIKESKFKKGNVLLIAELAGVQAAKKTFELIPFCHNIVLSHIRVHAEVQDDKVRITGCIRSRGQTGVEMEAMLAVSVAALTVYDMCKSASHDITISKVQLIEKSGGKSGLYKRNNDVNST